MKNKKQTIVRGELTLAKLKGHIDKLLADNPDCSDYIVWIDGCDCNEKACSCGPYIENGIITFSRIDNCSRKRHEGLDS